MGGGKTLEETSVSVDMQEPTPEDAASATENGDSGKNGTDENGDGSADDGTTAPADQSGDGSTQTPEELGDGSKEGENGQPQNPENPDDTEQPDENGTEEPGEEADPSAEEEGDLEDTADVIVEEESISMNALDAEPIAESEPAYKGNSSDETDGDWGYKLLRLSVFDEDGAVTEADILAALEYYKGTEQRFECIELNMEDKGSKKIKKDILNAANEILKKDHKDGEEDRYWIDYNFRNDTTKIDTNFNLYHPKDLTGDLNVQVTATPVSGLGVKVKFPAVSFPADNASANMSWEGTAAAALDETFAGVESDEDEDWEFGKYSVFSSASGKPTAVLRDTWANYWTDKNGESNVGWIQVGRISALKAGAEYLVAPVKTDSASVAMGANKTLTAPEGATNVEWKSYTPDVVSVVLNSDKKTAELSAWDRGTALYGVIYKKNNVQKADLYRVKVDKKLQGMKFDKDTLEMELFKKEDGSSYWECREYLQLYFDPADVRFDPGNNEVIEWTTSNASVVALVKDPEDNNYYGDIQALKGGTATITATYKADNTIKATCEVTVTEVLDYDDVKEAVDNKLYAVVGCDTTLEDVALPDGWAWVDKTTSLAPYADMDGHAFAAAYTTGGKSTTFMVWVRMVRVRELVMTSEQLKEGSDTEKEWVDWIDDFGPEGKELKMGFQYEFENLRWIEEENTESGGHYDPDELKAVIEKLNQKYTVEWTSTDKANPGKTGDGTLETVTVKNGTYTYTSKITGKTKKAEKKTFTVSVKDIKTKKVAYKASHTFTVTVGPPFEMERIDGLWPEKDEAGKSWLVLRWILPNDVQDKETTEDELQAAAADEAKRLTVVSTDTSLLKLDAKKTVVEGVEEPEEVKYGYMRISCTEPKPGVVWIRVTANDEIKSSELYPIETPDKEPKVLGAATRTINKQSAEKSVQIAVSTHEDYPLVEQGGKPFTINSDSFELTAIPEPEATSLSAQDAENEVGFYAMNLSLKDANLKPGSYAVELQFKVKGTEQNSTEETYTSKLTVKVTDVKPKVTFKQTGKLNLFYTDAEGAGTLQINTGERITSLELSDYTDEKKTANNAACHYSVQPKKLLNEEGNATEENELDENGNIVYEIVRKAGQTAFDESKKKGMLKYQVEGYAGTFETPFTVATEKKAPTVVPSMKTDTLYPSVWYMESWVQVTDKATKELIEPTAVRYVEGSGKNKSYKQVTIGPFKEDEDEQRTQEVEITGGSTNKFGLYVTPRSDIVFRLREAESYGKKADKMNLEIKEANWNEWVAVSYSVKVDTAKPKLALGASTLTLNKNADVYRGQLARTTLRLKGCGNIVMDEGGSWVSIVGQDDQAKKALKKWLVIEYRNDRNGDITVRFNNDNGIKPGTYQFRISAGNEDVGEYASTVLKVKIVDKTVKQSLKVSAKGSIDVMNREGTFIAYTPKLSNLTGTVVEGRLAGRDADLFDYYFEDGRLIVKANGWQTYSTKATYQFYAVFRVENEDWLEYKISTDQAKPFSIKLKQSKPKLKVTTEGNTIYRQRMNPVEIKLSATLGKRAVEIEDVWLLNYTEDLRLQSYDSETGSAELMLQDRYGTRDILQSGKTWKVKLAVRYRDKAGNEKLAEVTCPIVVR